MILHCTNRLVQLFMILHGIIFISNSLQQVQSLQNQVHQRPIPSATPQNSITVQLPDPPITSLEHQLIQTKILGNDISVSAEGDIYIVGVDGKWYTHSFASNTYTRVIADPDIDNIIRVDVDNTGTPYIVTNCGMTYYLSCDGKWIQLPGCATDIGAGFCGQVWKTGCNQRESGYGVWKWFCTGKEERCNRYREFNYNIKAKRGHNSNNKCYWNQVPGSGYRVDVYPDGNPAVIQSSGMAMKYNGIEWNMITRYMGKDITVSNEGVVMMTGIHNGVYIIKDGIDDDFKNWSGSDKVRTNEELDKSTSYVDVGCTMAISAGPFSQPAMIPCKEAYEPVVVLTQKFKYN